MPQLRFAVQRGLTSSCAHQDNLPEEEQVLPKGKRAHIPVAGSKARPRRLKPKDKFRRASKRLIIAGRMRAGSSDGAQLSIAEEGQLLELSAVQDQSREPLPP